MTGIGLVSRQLTWLQRYQPFGINCVLQHPNRGRAATCDLTESNPPQPHLAPVARFLGAPTPSGHLRTNDVGFRVKSNVSSSSLMPKLKSQAG